MGSWRVAADVDDILGPAGIVSCGEAKFLDISSGASSCVVAGPASVDVGMVAGMASGLRWQGGRLLNVKES